MYKEVVKSEKNPIGFVILWAVGMYLFYILWGIGAILLEVNPMPVIKHVILWISTGWFVYNIVSKFIIEYEFAARSNEFTITKKLSRKTQIILSLKYENIEAIYNLKDKNKLKNYKFRKKSNLIRAYQSGEIIHIVYKFNSKMNLLTIKASRQMIMQIKNNYSVKKEA